MENINNIFVTAVRNKYRYNFKGLITTEDLWDLSLANLKVIYTGVKEELSIVKGDDDNLFADTALDKKTAAKVEELENQLEILKYIVTTKKEEDVLRKKTAENTALKKKLTAILADKQEDALKNLSEEELLKKIAELG